MIESLLALPLWFEHPLMQSSNVVNRILVVTREWWLQTQRGLDAPVPVRTVSWKGWTEGCVCERERERDSVCMCVYEWKSGRKGIRRSEIFSSFSLSFSLSLSVSHTHTPGHAHTHSNSNFLSQRKVYELTSPLSLSLKHTHTSPTSSLSLSYTHAQAHRDHHPISFFLTHTLSLSECCDVDDAKSARAAASILRRRRFRNSSHFRRWEKKVKIASTKSVSSKRDLPQATPSKTFHVGGAYDFLLRKKNFFN